jgi:hypothetical protein
MCGLRIRILERVRVALCIRRVQVSDRTDGRKTRRETDDTVGIPKFAIGNTEGCQGRFGVCAVADEMRYRIKQW